MKKKTVLAGGTFNIIHPGHVYFLKKAKSLGDRLVVVVAHDKTVKNKKRLLFPAKQRANLVSSLKFVDKVKIGSWPPNFEKIIKAERPDIIAVGYDQNIKIKNLKTKSNLKFVKINRFGNYSTRKILKK